MIEIRQSLQQKQTLTMTPQLQQSLKILQFSTQELSDYIKEELENNPLLESDDEQTAPDNSEKPTEEVVPSIIESFEKETSPDETWSQYTGGSSDSFVDKDQYYEQTVAKTITMREHLLDQINVDFTSNTKKIIALHLLDILDENGYVEGSLESVRDLIECELPLIEEVLLHLQKFDPPGIFARSLAECLELQLQDKNRLDPAMKKLVENLDLIAKRELKKLLKICSVTSEDLTEMLAEIKALNPKPGSVFLQEIIRTAIPDVFLRLNPDDTFILELNSSTLPKLLVNKKYHAKIKKKTKGEYEKEYIMEQLNTANWLVKTLNQRAETILKVATEIVSQQSDFFKKGIYYLRPLILSDIAEQLGIHESTVGRATAGKYISTSRGLYEMKFFFSSSVSNAFSDDNYSSNTIKHIIAKVVEDESVDAILSDDKITEILNQKGIDIARRTVAKYREQLKIPSSLQRRRNKKMM